MQKPIRKRNENLSALYCLSGVAALDHYIKPLAVDKIEILRDSLPAMVRFHNFQFYFVSNSKKA